MLEGSSMKKYWKWIVVGLMVLFISPAFSEQEPPKSVRYSEYGATGNGVTDDFDAICKTHAAANKAGWKVCADPGATYYIGVTNQTASIQTDTDWKDARFIIDDSKVDVENRNRPIFHISSQLPSVRITHVKTLRKNQEHLDLSLPHDSFVSVTDPKRKRYIRWGLNQNNGSPQTDVFVIDKNGHVDKNAPIIWDFDDIPFMTVYPIDAQTLTIQGGHFTTIANQAESRYTYYARNIRVSRSNVVIDGLVHTIKDELEHGAPYGGFLDIRECAHVTVQNCTLSGHKTYSTIGSANKPVSMGSYDISVNKAIHVTFRNCKQINDIHDTKRWGIFGSNFSKNITFDGVEFSRFDAHMGVVNATIKNSILGHQGINLIGSGVFFLENTKVHSPNFINLRSDYGSTFEGEIIIRNCEYIPRNGAKSDAILINGAYSGQHDFGYPCSMPKKITIDGLVIRDNNPTDNYQGPRIFAAFNNAYRSDAYVEKYPYALTEEVEIRNLNIQSGKPWILSNNPYLFRNVRVSEPTNKTQSISN